MKKKLNSKDIALLSKVLSSARKGPMDRSLRPIRRRLKRLDDLFGLAISANVKYEV